MVLIMYDSVSVGLWCTQLILWNFLCSKLKVEQPVTVFISILKFTPSFALLIEPQPAVKQKSTLTKD